jgi:hypothetical protein
VVTAGGARVGGSQGDSEDAMSHIVDPAWDADDFEAECSSQVHKWCVEWRAQGLKLGPLLRAVRASLEIEEKREDRVQRESSQ